jgi:glycosyltransferase involved in cell wall biosynthesis
MLGISEVVNFHGLKSKSEVAEFMKRCDFLVVSSLFETFANVLIEAMACGRPIVTTDCGGPSEIVTPMIGIKVPPGNSETLADAINYMLDHHSEYSTDSIAKYVQECYSYQAVGSKFNSLYISLLRNREE